MVRNFEGKSIFKEKEKMRPQKGDSGLRLRGLKENLHFLRSLKRECGSASPFLKGVGKKGVDIIRYRTLEGIGVDGKEFPLIKNDAHAKKKGTRKRNLSSSGNPNKGMLGAIWFRVLGFKVVIYVKKIGREWIKAEVHNAGMISGRRNSRFQMPRAFFFGFNDRELKDLEQLVRENFLRFLKKYNKYFWGGKRI